jgi:hypothetical protein
MNWTEYKRLRAIEDNKPVYRKAKQWGFILYLSENKDINEEIERLSSLPKEDVVYIIFSVNKPIKVIQGFVKLSKRSRVGILHRLIGWAQFTVCPTPKTVRILIADIRSKPFSMEFSNRDEVVQGRRDFHAFKCAVASGKFTTEQLKICFPTLFEKNIAFVRQTIERESKSKYRTTPFPNIPNTPSNPHPNPYG